jgi:hypothetical protein
MPEGPPAGRPASVVAVAASVVAVESAVETESVAATLVDVTSGAGVVDEWSEPQAASTRTAPHTIGMKRRVRGIMTSPLS